MGGNKDQNLDGILSGRKLPQKESEWPMSYKMELPRKNSDYLPWTWTSLAQQASFPPPWGSAFGEGQSAEKVGLGKEKSWGWQGLLGSPSVFRVRTPWSFTLVTRACASKHTHRCTDTHEGRSEYLLQHSWPFSGKGHSQCSLFPGSQKVPDQEAKECLLCARHCPRCWGKSRVRPELPAPLYLTLHQGWQVHIEHRVSWDHCYINKTNPPPKQHWGWRGGWGKPLQGCNTELRCDYSTSVVHFDAWERAFGVEVQQAQRPCSRCVLGVWRKVNGVLKQNKWDGEFWHGELWDDWAQEGPQHKGVVSGLELILSMIRHHWGSRSLRSGVCDLTFNKIWWVALWWVHCGCWWEVEGMQELKRQFIRKVMCKSDIEIQWDGLGPSITASLCTYAVIHALATGDKWILKIRLLQQSV